MATLKSNSHRRPWVGERSHVRRKPNTEIYNSRQWRNLSKRHKMLNPLCVSCADAGRVSPAEVTDHIEPINKGGAAYDWNNLQSLCNMCHHKKSGSEAHEKDGK